MSSAALQMVTQLTMPPLPPSSTSGSDINEKHHHGERNDDQTVQTHGIRAFTLEASEAARRFVVKKGFSTIKRRDFIRNGAPIHNEAMEKDLP